MRGYLLDTNILSELRKGERTSPEVGRWWLGMQGEELYVSVMALGEIRKGIDRIAKHDANQSIVLERWLSELRAQFLERVLHVSPEVADRWGRLQGIRPLPETDALIAATAIWHDLVLVTRNECDFSGLGVTVLNPFSAGKP